MGRHLDTIHTPGDQERLPPDAISKQDELPGASAANGDGARRLARLGFGAAGLAAAVRALDSAASDGAWGAA
jgi:hypothetical protein